MNPLQDTEIGILGCGHLGRSLAQAFLRHGLPLARLRVSHGTSETTMAAIRAAGLADAVASNQDIAERCQAVFLAVRPQQAGSLGRLRFPRECLLVSCMAAISAKTLRALFARDVVRAMVSGPGTMRAGIAVAGVHPAEARATGLLREAGFTVFELAEEAGLQAFTVGVCLPAVLAETGNSPELTEAVSRIAEAFPLFARLFAWAQTALPAFATDGDRKAYVNAMCTKGGVTEAIVTELRRGAGALPALRAGFARCAALETAASEAEGTPLP